jgi:hypothetical protein
MGVEGCFVRGRKRREERKSRKKQKDARIGGGGVASCKYVE